LGRGFEALIVKVKLRAYSHGFFDIIRIYKNFFVRVEQLLFSGGSERYKDHIRIVAETARLFR
jgi:hypothetical protein